MLCGKVTADIFFKKPLKSLGISGIQQLSVFNEKIFSCPLLIKHWTLSVHFPFLRSVYLYRWVGESKRKAQMWSNMPHLASKVCHLVGKCENCRKIKKITVTRFNIISLHSVGRNKNLNGPHMAPGP